MCDNRGGRSSDCLARNDDEIGVTGVKLAAYFDALESGDGALRFLPGSPTPFEQAYRGFDQHLYPVWGDWLADAPRHLHRAAIVERMRAAGVLDLPGAEVGW